MKRSIVLFVLLVVSVLSMVVAAQQGGGQNAPKVVEVEKLKDNYDAWQAAARHWDLAMASLRIKLEEANLTIVRLNGGPIL